MNQGSIDRYAVGVRMVAKSFAYPPTPELRPDRLMRSAISTSRIHSPRRRLAWAMAVVLVALASLLAVPQARAAVIRWIRIGAVRIFINQPVGATPAAPVTATPALTGQPQFAPATPTQDMLAYASLSQMAGETTFDEAQARAAFKILSPAYPPDLGPPDRVFVQDQGGAMVILAWSSVDDPDKARLVVQELPSDSWGVKKVQIEAVTLTTVGGRPAVWAEGPYILMFRNGDLVERRLVEGHVLIWEQADVTYRLESDLPLEQAVRVAESLE